LASWAGLNRARDVSNLQVALFSVADADPDVLHPVTRPLGPTWRVTSTVPVSLLSIALGG
jgi:hypothetical protein